VQLMPFDGVLFASCIMVAKEAHTSSSIKDLIVAAAGAKEVLGKALIRSPQVAYLPFDRSWGNLSIRLRREP
jgi:Fatty acid synthase subunit beta/Fas1-like, helical